MDDLNAVVVETGVNPNLGIGWVRLTTHDKKTVMSPSEARDLAMNLLHGAEAAETDAALLKIGREVVGHEQAGTMLIQAMRDARGVPPKQKGN